MGYCGSVFMPNGTSFEDTDIYKKKSKKDLSSSKILFKFIFECSIVAYTIAIIITIYMVAIEKNVYLDDIFITFEEGFMWGIWVGFTILATIMIASSKHYKKMMPQEENEPAMKTQQLLQLPQQQSQYTPQIQPQQQSIPQQYQQQQLQQQSASPQYFPQPQSRSQTLQPQQQPNTSTSQSINYSQLNKKQLMEECKRRGIKVNSWTSDKKTLINILMKQNGVGRQ